MPSGAISNLAGTIGPSGGLLVEAASSGKTLKTVSGTFAADADLITAVTGKRLKVTSVRLYTFGTTANVLLWKSAGTTEVARDCLQAVDGQVMGTTGGAVPAPSFLFATAAGAKLSVDMVTPGDTIHYTLTYFDDDAT